MLLVSLVTSLIGPLEIFACEKDIVEGGEDHDSQKDGSGVVHVRAGDGQIRWEWQEYDEEDTECYCKNVDREADLAHRPRPESDRVRGVESADGEQDCWDGVGEVKSECRQRKQCVESSRGSDVDQGQTGHADEEEDDGVRRGPIAS